MSTLMAPSTLSRAWARAAVIDDPIYLLRAAGYEPDPWQQLVLTSEAPRIIMLASRQSGKSLLTSAKALSTAETRPNSLILIGSPSQNQSKELLRAAMGIFNATGGGARPLGESVMRVTLANRSRMICVPGSTGTVRGYSSVRLLIVDEAAYVEDDFYEAVLPMVAISKGRIMLLSTPHAKAGTFYEIWMNAPVYDPGVPAADQPNAWLKVKVTWDQCPRITPEFIEGYRAIKGDIAYRKEFLCLPGATLVAMSVGADSPIAGLRPGDRLVAGDGGDCAVVASRQTGIQRLLTVTTEAGTTLSATSDHPVRVDGAKTALSAAAALEVAFHPVRRGGAIGALARLVGWNLGDGHARLTPRPSAHFYSVVAADLADVATDLVTAGICEEPPPVRAKRTAERVDYSIHVYGDRARALIDAGCIAGAKVFAPMHVPDWVMAGSQDVQAEFLGALWGAEGATPIVSHGSAKGANAPRLAMTHRDRAAGHAFFGELATLHGRLGSQTSVTVAPVARWGYICTLRVLGGASGAAHFYRAIGYRYAMRKEQLGFLWRHYLGAVQRAGVMRRAAVTVLRGQGMTYAQIAASTGVTWRQAAFLATTQPSGRSGHDFAGFTDWTASRWDGRILRLAIDERALGTVAVPVYNIEVDSADHSYLLADGTVTFNCEFLEAEAAVFTRAEVDLMDMPQIETWSVW